MNYYICPKCVDNERNFNTFHELRLHVEYDHGLWCLGKGAFASEPHFHQGRRLSLSSGIKNINTKYELGYINNVEKKLKIDSEFKELKLSKMYQDLISIMAERDELNRQLQLTKMNSDVIKVELIEKTKLTIELQNVIDEAYKHESRGRKRIESYFEELISLIFKAEKKIENLNE